MQLSFLLAEQILAMAMMVFAGYVAVRCNVLRSQDSHTLSALAIYIIGPCMMLHAFQIPLTQDKVIGLLFAVAAAIVVHMLFILFARATGQLFHTTATERASLVYTNCGNLLLPLISAILDKESLFYACAFIAVQAFFIWTHGYMLISGEKHINWGKIFKNPNIISIFLGLGLFFTGTTLPAVVNTAVDGIGGMIGPISMLIIGMLMASTDIGAVLRSRRAYLVCFLRLLAFPLLVIVLYCISPLSTLYPDSSAIFLVTVLAACAPAASSVTQFAELFHGDARQASVLNIMSVLFCIVTMPLMVAVYQWMI